MESLIIRINLSRAQLQRSCYVPYKLSYREIEEIQLERGVVVDHATINRWVIKFAPLLEHRA